MNNERTQKMIGLSELCDRLKLEAQMHAQEARAANATIAEIYQLVTGSTGEPGNWNGAAPVRALVAENARLRADNAVLVDALEWARLYVKDASQRSIGEGIREEAARRLAIIDAAIAKANGDAS